MTNFEWLVERVGYQGDECLTWPFARVRGYVPVDQLAVLHGVSRRTIQQIHSGRVYKRFKRAA